MHDDATARPELSNGPWRVLILDRDPDDPMWVIATVTIAADVRPASVDAAGRYQGWSDVCHWVAETTGLPVALTPLHDALAWRVDESR